MRGVVVRSTARGFLEEKRFANRSPHTSGEPRIEAANEAALSAHREISNVDRYGISRSRK